MFHFPDNVFKYIMHIHDNIGLQGESSNNHIKLKSPFTVNFHGNIFYVK